MSRYPDLVQGTKLDTSFADDYTVHEHDDSEDEQRLGRPAQRAEYWATERLLAEGGFGKVYLQRCVRGWRRVEWRAVKVVSKRKSRAQKIDYIIELEAIAKFSQKRYSKCFVKLLGWYDTDNHLYIAMEYFPLGDLQRHMSENPPLPEPDAQHVSYQVLEGLEYMHSEDFAYRDIKPGNVLIKSRTPDGSWWVKLSDFGISKRFDPSAEQLSTIKGTRIYMAPELSNHESGTPLVINHQAADMWSVGEMVFRMLSKTAAFPTLQALSSYLARPDFFPSNQLKKNGAGKQAVDFIQSLMRLAPEDRLTSSQALDHPWLRPLRPSPLVISPIAPRSGSTTPIPPMGSELATGIGQWATVSSTDMGMSRASLSAPLRPTTGPLAIRAPEFESRGSVSLLPPPQLLVPLTNHSSDDPGAPHPLQSAPEHTTFANRSRKPIEDSIHLSTLKSMNNLGNIGNTLYGQGKYAEAEPIFRKALELREKVLGCDHPSTLKSMNGLGNTLHGQGKYAEAEPIFRKALELREKVLGCDHPSTLKSMNGLGNTLYGQGKYAEAEPIFRKALELREKVLGRDHPSTLKSMNDLGKTLHNQGKYAEAKQTRKERKERERRKTERMRSAVSR